MLMEWLRANQQWVFSGVGIFVASSIVGFLSVIATVLIQRRRERRSRKKLHIRRIVSQFRIPATSQESGVSTHDIQVSYEGREFSYLNYYSIQMENEGQFAIENQRLWIKFPKSTQIIEQNIETSNAMVKTETEYPEAPDRLSRVITINRLEPGDKCSFAALVDTDSPETIECEPRGVDKIDYRWGEDSNIEDPQKLILWVAAFFFAGAIPVFGGLLQALAVVGAGPLVFRLLGSLRRTQVTMGNTVSMGESNISVHAGDTQDYP